MNKSAGQRRLCSLYRSVVAADSTAVQAHYHLGRLYGEREQFALQVGLWTRVLDLQPDHPEADRIDRLLARRGAPHGP